MASSSTAKEYIDAKLQKAAEKGKFDEFNDYQGTLDSLLTPNENTVLHIYLTSTSKRSIDFIKKVLDDTPSLLLKVNVYGDTPLHIAARYGHAKAAKELIKRRKERDIESEESLRKMLGMENKNKETALHEAARNEDSLGVVKAILNHEDPPFTYSANDCGETPLYLAASNGCQKIVSELLSNPNSQPLAYGGPNGKTALHAAAIRRNYKYGKIIEKLLEKLSGLAKETDENGWTPLHYAVHARNTPAVKTLLSKDKSSAYISDKSWKRTPLLIAASRDYQDIVEEIISKCPGCCEQTDARGWNVFHYAVISKRDKVLKALLQKHSSLIYLINGKDEKGHTPVHLCKAYHPKLPYFIRKGNTDKFKLWRKLHCQIPRYSSSKKKEILEWMEDLGTGPLGEIQYYEKENREANMMLKFEKAKDSHLVAAALIATVTFTAAFTVPGGFLSDDKSANTSAGNLTQANTSANKRYLKLGSPILAEKSAFKAFIISDTIAMVLSTCSVFIHLVLAISGYLERYYWLISYAFNFLFLAMLAMVITLVTGVCAYLKASLSAVVYGIGFIFSVFLFYLIIRVLWSFSSLDDHEDVVGVKKIFLWLIGGIFSRSRKFSNDDDDDDDDDHKMEALPLLWLIVRIILCLCILFLLLTLFLRLFYPPTHVNYY